MPGTKCYIKYESNYMKYENRQAAQLLKLATQSLCYIYLLPCNNVGSSVIAPFVYEYFLNASHPVFQMCFELCLEKILYPRHSSIPGWAKLFLILKSMIVKLLYLAKFINPEKNNRLPYMPS